MTSSASFVINGRFLNASITGVQRYAHGVVSAIDARGPEGAVLLAPPQSKNPGLANIPLVEAGALRGQAWEQIVLPAKTPGMLLNLCNTAPLSKRDQVVCIHDVNVFAMPSSYSSAFRRYYRFLLPLIGQRSSSISTVSNFSARQIEHHLGVSAKKLVVLPNGHEHALAWDPGAARIAPEALGRIRGSEEIPFVLAIGSRAKHKNVQLLLTLAPRLAERGVHVVIAGGDGGIFAAEELAKSPNVHLLGRVEDDDIAYLMTRALCLAFPSWTEGFGLPIVEAMARGCPVISSDRASMPEICGDAALLAAPEDPETWVQHIFTLLDTRSLRSEMVGRGSERVQHFRWSETAAGYLDLLRSPGHVQRRSSTAAHAKPLRVAVVIATIGRPDIVSTTVRHLLATQTLQPALTLISCPKVADAGDLGEIDGVSILIGPTGLPNQRNTALEALPDDIDVVAFFDDDFVAHAQWLEAAVRVFQSEADVDCLTGDVLADGIKGPGLTFDEARTIACSEAASERKRVEPYSPYGCNMAFRASRIRDARFDQRLVLYGWLEDRDFGARLAQRGGRLIKCPDARGVHMGVKSGRVAGERLGYSQIVNPIYMFRKGTMTLGQVGDQMFRNVFSNTIKFAKPEPFIDRRGRLRGNMLGFWDIARGKITPERAAEIAIKVRPRP